LPGFDDDKDGYIRKPACSYEKLEPRKIRKKTMFWDPGNGEVLCKLGHISHLFEEKHKPRGMFWRDLNQNLSPRQILSGMVMKELLKGIPFLRGFDFTSLPCPEFAKKCTYRH